MVVGCVGEMFVDQCIEDGGVLIFDMFVLEQDLEILGVLEIVLYLVLDQLVVYLVVWLGDVVFDGKVVCVSYQVLNLIYCDGYEVLKLL